MNLRITAVAAASAGLAATALVSAPPAAAAPSDWDLVFTQDTPKIVNTIVIKDRVIEVTWEAVLRNRSGDKVGMVFGSQRDFEASPGGKREARFRTLIFTFKDGQIVAQGLATYTVSGDFLKAGKRSVIAITGGTGAYAGVSGELKTVRTFKGIHRQMLRFT